MEEPRLEGGCACGAVRYGVSGPPIRVGLCHCMTCRKKHGAAFNCFVVYDRRRFRVTGETSVWASSDVGRRHSCAVCASPVFMEDEGGGELHVGGFDDVGVVAPSYEIWTRRREPWLPGLGLEMRP
jgi:hypothetical protein